MQLGRPIQGRENLTPVGTQNPRQTWLPVPLRGGENLTLVGAHRIQDKCGYLCLTLNALLRIAVCSAQDALFGIVSIYKCPAPYSSMFCSGCPKCSYLEYSIQSRTCGCAELSEVSLVIQSAPSEYQHYLESGFV